MFLSWGRAFVINQSIMYLVVLNTEAQEILRANLAAADADMARRRAVAEQRVVAARKRRAAAAVKARRFNRHGRPTCAAARGFEALLAIKPTLHTGVFAVAKF